MPLIRAHWEKGKPSTDPWTPAATFDKYERNGNLDPTVKNPDMYRAPSENDPGTGFTPFDADGSGDCIATNRQLVVNSRVGTRK